MKLNTQIKLLGVILTVTIAVSVLGKVTRSFFLSRENVTYYPKDLYGNEIDLALCLNLQWKQQRQKSGFFSGEQLESIVNDDAVRVSDKTALKRLAAQLKTAGKTDAEITSVKPKDYWDQSNGNNFVISGMIDRLDDVAFANVLALAIFIWFLAFLVRRFEKLDSSQPWGRKRVGAVWLWIMVLPFGLLPQIQHLLGDRGPLHGTFWTSDFISPVQWTQWLDGVLWLIAAIVYVFAIAIYAQMLAAFDITCTVERTEAYNWLVYCCLMLPSWLLTWWGLIKSDFFGLKLHPPNGIVLLYILGLYLFVLWLGLRRLSSALRPKDTNLLASWEKPGVHLPWFTLELDSSYSEESGNCEVPPCRGESVKGCASTPPGLSHE